MSVPFEETRLTLPHTEIAAHLYGPVDGRPVIALHGWLDNAASFHRLAPRLDGLRIVALDLPGHGHSQHRPPGATYQIWDYAHDVLQVAEQLGWQRFSLLGHSMGAIVSVLLAGAWPERVERLALIDAFIPYTGEAEAAPVKLGEALKAQLALARKRKPVHASFEQAVAARMKAAVKVSHEAAELLAQRGADACAGRLHLAHRSAPDAAIADAADPSPCAGLRQRRQLSDQSRRSRAWLDAGGRHARAGAFFPVRGAAHARRPPSASG
jgi:pimeloyl-ACP methyl ester carboxylesterase